MDQLRNEPEYVKRRYQAVARARSPHPFHVTRKDAARSIDRCLRQFYRILKRFCTRGIPGLRLRSKRPKSSPRQTAPDIARKVVDVRKVSGFGPNHVAVLVNEGFRREESSTRIPSSTVYNILVREGEIERERRIQNEWKHFEWGHPNRLIQADLTKFNGVPILTMEDDNSRHGWAVALENEKNKTVIKGMKNLISHKYDNLLTDNGSQFSRRNSAMRKYCEEVLNEKHIWTSIHHPETMGKLSAFQKGLKRFLRHQLRNSRDLDAINYWIAVYDDWYNNGKHHRDINCVPATRYKGKPEEGWYERLVKALKL